MNSSELYPKISIVCAWFNRSKYISSTINSLLSQDFDDFEVIIVNDGSTDCKVREILDSYNDPRLRVIHQENTGFVKAIMHGINCSRGKFIAIQGAGDISKSNRLAVQYKILNDNPDIVAVSAKAEIISVKEGGSEEFVYVKNPTQHRITSKYFLRGEFLIHGATTFRRDIYQKVGGYRHIFKYSQDNDLWLRMTEYGDFKVANEILYKVKVFLEDGIGADIDKQLIQRKLSDLAINCYKMKKSLGKDFIDIYGDYALLMGRRSRSSSKLLGTNLIKFLIMNDIHSAEVIRNKLIFESLTLQSIFSSILLFFCRHSPMFFRILRFAGSYIRFATVKKVDV